MMMIEILIIIVIIIIPIILIILEEGEDIFVYFNFKLTLPQNELQT